MPKIIENVREMLIDEAKRQLEENGYSAVTVRSIAGACGLGTGTFYNYFRSKDILIATVMLEDWNTCIDAVAACAQSEPSPDSLLRCIYDELCGYTDRHAALFADPQAKKVFSGEISRYHGQLRAQLALQLEKLCAAKKCENASFLAEFIAEAMLTWTLAGRSYDDISGIIIKLFDK